MASQQSKTNLEKYLFVLLVPMCIFFTLSIPNLFWSLNNFLSISSQIPLLGFLTFAMAITMLTGGINLSIIPITNASALVMGLIAVNLPDSIIYLPIVLLGGLSVGLLTGALNGSLIAKVRVSPILATLGTMTFINGLNVLISGGKAVSNFPDYILNIEKISILGIPFPMVLFLIVAIFLGLILEKTSFGKSIYMVGSNEKAAYYSGINTNRILILTYILSSFLCVLAALIMMSKFNSAKSSYGESFLLVTILASVLGGLNPDGGFGKIIGVVIALLLLQAMESGFNMIGINSFLTMAFWGGTLITFIYLRNQDEKISRYLKKLIPEKPQNKQLHK
ncbi:ABC transporter permease [Vibrio litoralis]|uniref:ABC transporter permease n=1 Tax=Vibrio litoralis TaxID=335972 RepID=UPI0003FFA722|nr:ABC transporter permease [Vibrio litoralis]